MPGPKEIIYMPAQDPEKRKKNFDEVALGLSEEQAVSEAQRCLNCKKPLCMQGCPVGISIPEFIMLIKERKFLEAARVIKKENLLPAICGRVCPQEDQCEKACVLDRTGKAIAIGYLERFAADYEMKNSQHKKEKGAISHQPSAISSQQCKIAVIGSGPSGLTCASELRKKGYQVTLFEAFHKPGGVLMYGIPSFRLPKEIVKYEIDNLRKMGVEIKVNSVIGRLKTVDQLIKDEGYSAVYIATGAGHPVFMGIVGEELNYIYSSNEFLTRCNLMEAYKFPETDTPIVLGKRVAVIGGGNTAMDSARCALRMGTEKVYCVYRRSEKEMPARVEEIEHAKEEGIEFMFLTAPVRYTGDEDNNVKKAVCIKMELGEPDASGRRRPVPIEGSEFEIEVDSVIVAIGTNANPLISDTTDNLEVNKWGYITTDEEGRTTKKQVYAGGDIVTGSATVIEAMGAGKKAAHIIDKDLCRDRS
ncbi:MAG: NADPH-dependent glutamate synthase [Candidatus Omnitrophica bacterium]|nr:NADPH-dependent glutamate synthase [Candidatus Omnitrophota bacterium]